MGSNGFPFLSNFDSHTPMILIDDAIAHQRWTAGQATDKNHTFSPAFDMCSLIHTELVIMDYG